MREQVYDEPNETTPAPAPVSDGELVHWMGRPPLRVGPAGMSITAGVAFAGGFVAAVGILALLHLLGPERKVVIPRRRFRARSRASSH